jgi:hypothetical protein
VDNLIKKKEKKDELSNNRFRINQNNTEIFTNNKKWVNKLYKSFTGSHKAVSYVKDIQNKTSLFISQLEINNNHPNEVEVIKTL